MRKVKEKTIIKIIMNITSIFLRINFEFLQYLKKIANNGFLDADLSKEELKSYLMLFLKTRCNITIAELPTSVQVMLIGSIEKLIHTWKKRREIENTYLRKRRKIQAQKRLRQLHSEMENKRYFQRLKEHFEGMIDRALVKAKEDKKRLEDILFTLDLEGLLFYREFLHDLKDIYIRDQRCLDHQALKKEELIEIFGKYSKLKPAYHQRCILIIDQIDTPPSLAEILILIERSDSLIMRLQIYSGGSAFSKPILFSRNHHQLFDNHGAEVGQKLIFREAPSINPTLMPFVNLPKDSLLDKSLKMPLIQNQKETLFFESVDTPLASPFVNEKSIHSSSMSVFPNLSPKAKTKRPRFEPQNVAGG